MKDHSNERMDSLGTCRLHVWKQVDWWHIFPSLSPPNPPPPSCLPALQQTTCCSLLCFSAPISHRLHTPSPPVFLPIHPFISAPNSSRHFLETRQASLPEKQVVERSRQERFPSTSPPPNPTPQSHSKLCHRLAVVTFPGSLPPFLGTKQIFMEHTLSPLTWAPSNLLPPQSLLHPHTWVSASNMQKHILPRMLNDHTLQNLGIPYQPPHPPKKQSGEKKPRSKTFTHEDKTRYEYLELQSSETQMLRQKYKNTISKSQDSVSTRT